MTICRPVALLLLLLLSSPTLMSPAHAADAVPPLQRKTQDRVPLLLSDDGVAAPADPLERLPGTDHKTDSVNSTVDEFLTLALTSHPGLAAARARISASQGVWEQVGLKPNPGLGFVSDEIGNEDAAGMHGVFFRKTIVRGNKLPLNRGVAAHDVQAARQQLVAMEWQVRNDVRRAFYDALIAQLREDVTARLTALATDSETTVKKLFGAEELSRISVLQAGTLRQMTQLKLVSATAAHEAARRQLAIAAAVPELEVPRLDGDPLGELPSLEWYTERERLLADSPRIAVQWAKIERAKCALARARAEQIPDVQFQASVQFDDSTNDTVAGFSVARPILVHDWNQGNIRKACAELAEARHELERTRLALENQLAAAYQRYSIAKGQLDHYTNEILPGTRETLEIVHKGFEAGQVDYLTVLTTERTHYQTYIQFLDAVQDAWRAVVGIEGLLLTGSLQTGT